MSAWKGEAERFALKGQVKKENEKQIIVVFVNISRVIFLTEGYVMNDAHFLWL
jgi:hypothetical protein